MILEGVNFDTDATGIRPEVARLLDKLVADLKRCPKVRLRIEAHTDSVGDASYNHRLSQLRAAVGTRLLSSAHGISRERLTTRGLGERLTHCEQLECVRDAHRIGVSRSVHWGKW